MASGINVSKANAYAIVATPQGAAVAKTNIYAVVESNTGINVLKANVYTVITPKPTDKTTYINFL